MLKLVASCQALDSDMLTLFWPSEESLEVDLGTIRIVCIGSVIDLDLRSRVGGKTILAKLPSADI